MKCFLKALLFVIPAFACGELYAQKQGRDLINSLLQQLPKTTEDTDRANIYIELSNNYANYATDSGIMFGAKALELVNQLKSVRGIANANYFLGFNYYNRSDYPDALEHLFNALKSFESIGDETGIANTTRKIGNVYRDQKNYTKALEYYFKSLKIFENAGDKLGMGKCYSNIGEIYAFEHKDTDAMEFDNKALKIDEEAGYTNGMVITYLRVGDIYINDRNYQEGLGYKLKALGIAVANYDKNTIAKEQLQEAYGGVGKCYLEIAKSISSDKISAKKDTALQKSIYHLQKAISLVVDMGELVDLQAYYTCLSEAESLSGNYKNAYHDMWLSYQLQDSLFSAKNNIRISDLETQREKELKDRISDLERIKKRNETIVIIAGFSLLLVIIGIIFRNNKLLSFEKKKSDDLLLNILPSEVAEELKDKGSAEAKLFNNVTVLFTDFVSFTKVSERLSPKELVNELDACFKAFDEITGRYNIEKIKTIGDAYLAVCGLPLADPKHAENIVQAAIEINAFMQDRVAKLGNSTFQIRIGIHSGSVVAGIVGVKKFAYDIWGDTVNTAARMEQNSAPGKINISQITYELVKDKFNCEYRGEIDAKGKGGLKMYFVNT